MALVINDRVKETSTTTGTGTLNLSGAVSGFETFVAGIADGNTTYYAIVNRDEDEWEVGLGTVTDASTDTLARTTVITSSNSFTSILILFRKYLLIILPLTSAHSFANFKYLFSKFFIYFVIINLKFKNP